jgi:hypothetical protein
MDRFDSSQILGSWKEIAAYLGKGVRTVQRWEQLHGLPVRRPNGAPRGVVYSSREELDHWLLTQWSQRSGEMAEPAGPAVFSRPTTELIETHYALRHENQNLVNLIKLRLEQMKQECFALAQTIQISKQIKATPPPGWVRGPEHSRV